MFTKLIEKDRVPHAVLLAGANSQLIEAEALKFAYQLSAVPDIYEFRPEGKLVLHTIEKMKELKEEVYLPPYQHKRKVFIVFDADKMWPQASNSLLKTFEEPSESSILILTTTRKERMLPTILSRCQTFWVKGAAKPRELSSAVVEFLAHGRYSDSKSFFAQIKKISQAFEGIEEPIALQAAAAELFYEMEERHPDKRAFLDEARLKLERSTSMGATLESLFIKLGYL